MSKLIICRGLPASGKDYWARNYLKEQLEQDNIKVMIVNRDALRFQAGLGSAPTVYEPTITRQEQALMRNGLKGGYTVISTNMNLRAQYVKGFAEIAEEFGASVEIKDFDTDLELCIQRDAQRGAAGGHEVGADFIRRTHKQFFFNGFPKSPLERKYEEFIIKPYVPNIILRKAVIFDIDGTLADCQGVRSPYDYSKVIEDKPHLDVLRMVDDFAALDYKIIFLSGREDSCKKETLWWLQDHLNSVSPRKDDEDHAAPLYMRKTGDKRADFIIKHELFWKHVADKYNVVGVFDDRKQVIDGCWRAMGIRCYDVAGHTF